MNPSVPDEERQDPEITAAIRKSLDAVPSLRARQTRLARADVRALDGVAAGDANHSLGRFVVELAQQSLGVAVDHLETWRRLFEDARVQPGWAHVTLSPDPPTVAA